MDAKEKLRWVEQGLQHGFFRGIDEILPLLRAEEKGLWSYWGWMFHFGSTEAVTAITWSRWHTDYLGREAPAEDWRPGIPLPAPLPEMDIATAEGYHLAMVSKPPFSVKRELLLYENPEKQHELSIREVFSEGFRTGLFLSIIERIDLGPAGESPSRLSFAVEDYTVWYKRIFCSSKGFYGF